jgi:hypothetical protein
MAAKSKCLAQSNKSETGSKATKKWRQRGAISCASQVSQRQDPLAGQRCYFMTVRVRGENDKVKLAEFCA